jgi:hypothetical protein
VCSTSWPSSYSLTSTTVTGTPDTSAGRSSTRDSERIAVRPSVPSNRVARIVEGGKRGVVDRGREPRRVTGRLRGRAPLGFLIVVVAAGGGGEGEEEECTEYPKESEPASVFAERRSLLSSTSVPQPGVEGQVLITPGYELGGCIRGGFVVKLDVDTGDALDL